MHEAIHVHNLVDYGCWGSINTIRHITKPDSITAGVPSRLQESDLPVSSVSRVLVHTIRIQSINQQAGAEIDESAAVY